MTKSRGEALGSGSVLRAGTSGIGAVARAGTVGGPPEPGCSGAAARAGTAGGDAPRRVVDEHSLYA
jgi:hypothetical protein